MGALADGKEQRGVRRDDIANTPREHGVGKKCREGRLRASRECDPARGRVRAAHITGQRVAPVGGVRGVYAGKIAVAVLCISPEAGLSRAMCE